MTKVKRNWFFSVTGSGTTRGTRFKNGDKPPESTFQNLADSVLMFDETSDRAKVYDEDAEIKNQVGHVVLSSDVQAKVNTTQLADRSLVVQPHQLPTVTSVKLNEDDENVDGTDDTLASDTKQLLLDAGLDLESFVSVIASVDPSVSTRNKNQIRLSNAFLNFLAISQDPYKSFSTSSQTVGTGSKIFTVGTGYDYAIGNRVRATSAVDDGTYVEGLVTAYLGGTLIIDSDNYAGAGTINSWELNLGGSAITTSVDTNIEYLTASSVDIFDTSKRFYLVTPNIGSFPETWSGHLLVNVATDGNSVTMTISIALSELSNGNIDLEDIKLVINTTDFPELASFIPARDMLGVGNGNPTARIEGGYYFGNVAVGTSSGNVTINPYYDTLLSGNNAIQFRLDVDVATDTVSQISMDSEAEDTFEYCSTFVYSRLGN